MQEYIVILVTTDSSDSAQRIGQSLVNKKLVACCNIVSNIKSIFRWKGKIDKSDEVLLILKTKKDVFQKVVQEVRNLHPYEVPEIIALPIVYGNKDYLGWIEKEVEG